MTLLTTWAADDPATVLTRTGDDGAVTAALAAVGVRFARWPVRPTGGGTADEVLAAYRDLVDEISAAEGYVQVDVAALHPSDNPGFPAAAAAARAKFLAEHTHADDEVRFFAAGAGVFYLHLAGPDGEVVHAVLCTAGDLLSVPAGTTHWFDMGTAPDFTAVRFFRDPEGWVGAFTGSDIASAFPDFDTLAAQAPVPASG